MQRGKEAVIRELLEATIEDLTDGKLTLSDLSDSQVDALTQTVDRTAFQATFKILPGGFAGTGKIVVCAMPNNQQTIARSAAVQCQNGSCSEYFCKSHAITQCPLCGGTLK
jgi:hypothetical protein